MNTNREYIMRLRKRQRFRRLFPFLPFIGLAIDMILIAIVRAGPRVGIPISASQYMLTTVFYRFSSTELSGLLSAQTSGNLSFPLLLVIYWGYHVIVLFSIIPMAIDFALRIRKRGRDDFKTGLLSTWQILEALRKYLQHRTLFNRFILYSSVVSSKLFPLISPIRYRWYYRPSYQWISSSEIPHDYRSVLMAITRFENSFRYSIRHSTYLNLYIKPITLLHEFFYSVALRSDETLGHMRTSENSGVNYEMHKLLTFARLARPIIINVAKLRRQSKPPSKLSKLINQTLRSESFRNAFLISIISALVMFLGVLLFKINPDQAFITWFTVSFGSITISIGINSFSFVRNKEEDVFDENEFSN